VPKVENNPVATGNTPTITLIIALTLSHPVASGSLKTSIAPYTEVIAEPKAIIVLVALAIPSAQS
jgi:hypothetical protein